MQLLIVGIDERRFGVRTDDVVELAPMVQLAHLPRAPSAVEGVIDWHGDPLAVVDLRRRLHLEPRPPALSDRLVVVTAAGTTIALRVDTAADIVDIDEATLHTDELPPAERVAGVASTPDGLLVILDLREFLTAEEADLLGTALADAGART